MEELGDELHLRRDERVLRRDAEREREHTRTVWSVMGALCAVEKQTKSEIIQMEQNVNLSIKFSLISRMEGT